jgi:hypothetical protein
LPLVAEDFHNVSATRLLDFFECKNTGAISDCDYAHNRANADNNSQNCKENAHWVLAQAGKTYE